MSAIVEYATVSSQLEIIRSLLNEAKGVPIADLIHFLDRAEKITINTKNLIDSKWAEVKSLNNLINETPSKLLEEAVETMAFAVAEFKEDSFLEAINKIYKAKQIIDGEQK